VITYWKPGDPVPDGRSRRYVDPKSGYVRIRWKIAPGQIVEAWEHIWLAGRPGMEVHHRNLIRSDNAPGNLLCITPREHRAIHAALRAPDAERIVALYLTGMSSPVIGRLVGCHPSTVSRVLARSSVPARREAWNRSQFDDSAALDRLRRGDRVDAIARDLRVARSAIDRLRIANEIPACAPGRPSAATAGCTTS